MGFEQASIKVVQEREFGELRAVVEKAFAADQVAKYLKALQGRSIHARDLEAALKQNVLDRAVGRSAGSAWALYEALPVSDQAQIREFYLSKVEEVDLALRARFYKVYRYS